MVRTVPQSARIGPMSPTGAMYTCASQKALLRPWHSPTVPNVGSQMARCIDSDARAPRCATHVEHCRAVGERGRGHQELRQLFSRGRGNAPADWQSCPLYSVGPAGDLARGQRGDTGLRETLMDPVSESVSPGSPIATRALRAATRGAPRPQGAQSRAGV